MAWNSTTYGGPTLETAGPNVFDPPCLVFSFPPRVGDHDFKDCHYTSGASSFDLGRGFQVKANETVTVPAGTFDAARIDLIGSSMFDHATSVWYSEKACGVVKAVSSSEGWTKELTSFHCQ